MEKSVIQFKNLTCHLFSKMLKIRIYKTILPAFSGVVKSGFLLRGKNTNCKIRKIFGIMKDKITEQLRILHNEKL